MLRHVILLGMQCVLYWRTYCKACWQWQSVCWNT